MKQILWIIPIGIIAIYFIMTENKVVSYDQKISSKKADIWDERFEQSFIDSEIEFHGGYDNDKKVYLENLKKRKRDSIARMNDAEKEVKKLETELESTTFKQDEILKDTETQYKSFKLKKVEPFSEEDLNKL